VIPAIAPEVERLTVLQRTPIWCLPKPDAPIAPRSRLILDRLPGARQAARALSQAYVELETTAIDSFIPTGVRMADGAEHEVEVLVLATGVKVFEKGNMPAFPVEGLDGVDLGEWWDENRFQAYEGVSVPGFPNLHDPRALRIQRRQLLHPDREPDPPHRPLSAPRP
jgi:cation diffusion facilitator CzcD-associated flavoprotein CzcO